jgi:hypothetical protein
VAQSAEFLQGRPAIVAFSPQMGEGCGVSPDQGSLSVRSKFHRGAFQYEWHDDAGQWHRSYGNEQWEFDDKGLMRRREASINDYPIAETSALSVAGTASGRCRRIEREPVLTGQWQDCF